MSFPSIRFTVKLCAAICALLAAPAALAQAFLYPESDELYVIHLPGNSCYVRFFDGQVADDWESVSGNVSMECLSTDREFGRWTVMENSVTLSGLSDSLNVILESSCPSGWWSLLVDEEMTEHEPCWVNWSADIELVYRDLSERVYRYE